MADWRDALQDAMYPILTRLLQEGFVLPLFVTCIGRNGSMMCGRYDDIEATGLDFIVEASHLEGETFLSPSTCSSWISGAKRDMCSLSVKGDRIPLPCASDSEHIRCAGARA